MNMNIQESAGNRPVKENRSTEGALPLTVPQPGLKRGCAGYERAARARARGLDALPACREAGYENITPANARKLVNKPVVKARVAYLMLDEEAVLREQRQILMERQWLWHESDIADYFYLVEEPMLYEGKPVLDAAGEPVMRKVERPKPLEELSREQRLCIDGITWTERGKPNLKLYSKADANKELRKLLGIDKPLKVAATDTQGNDIPVTHEERVRALAAIFARVRAENAAAEASTKAGDASAPAGGA
jgi:hypothetical protein